MKELAVELELVNNKTGAFLKKIITSNVDRLSVSDIAKRARIDRSYLHHALNGRKRLSLEQIVRVSEILKLDDKQTEFVIHLALYEQAEHPKLKTYFYEKLGLWNPIPQETKV